GVYPIEPLEPVEGYTLDFESSDGDDEQGDWEEWPDRYVFDVVVSAGRLRPMVFELLSLMPARVYPILDVLGRDAHREIDPYISYDLLGLDALFDGLITFGDAFFEDGLIGFGAMSDAPFFYVFVDEHKIVTIRCEPELKPRVERIVHSFDLAERNDAAGADSVAHEHRAVLLAPEDRPYLLSLDEVVERLRDSWRLLLNVDPESNVDDRGRPLGITPWRCVVRVGDGRSALRYAEVLLTAGSMREAEDLALDGVLAESASLPPGAEPMVIVSDRLGPMDFIRELGDKPGRVTKESLQQTRLWQRRWLDAAVG
ncbi:MAG: hypothetical protein AAGF47_11965, partial [Planctomycetota bacterium]